MKIKKFPISIVLFIVFWTTQTHLYALTPDKNLGIIPQPNHIRMKGKTSDISTLKIHLDKNMNSPFYTDLFKGVEGITVVEKKYANVLLKSDDLLGQEAYSIDVTQHQVIISASSGKGFQYALTSLVQMYRFHGLPLPQVLIQDNPVFGYRGMHLDVARHFFTADEVKKYLDYMAMYKFNRFHWHLTDDQGWRVEIKKYPKLQEIAAYRDETLIGHYNDQPHKYDGKRYGGYYTQETIREIVRYAADRNIEIIPELDIPGHSMAALSAYPELGCENKVYKAATSWGVFEDVLCPNEVTFKFLEDVMDEIMALFPGKYIHIGGDECPKEAWKKSDFCQQLIKDKNLKNEEGLQSYFVTRIAGYIQSKGREIIGWDEILEGGLAPGAIVMSWRGVEGGIEAAKQHHYVIMTPNSHCYFDYYQSESPGEPISIGGFIPMEKVYDWNPVPSELTPEQRKYILGGQSNLWTEYIHTFDHVEYMTFARDMALSEALWSKDKDYRRFLNKFEKHYTYWVNKGAHVAFHIYDLKHHVKSEIGKPVQLYFDVPQQATIYYNYEDDNLGTMNGLDTITIDKSGKYTFIASKNNQRGHPLELNFNLHKATTARIHLETLPSDRYAGRGPQSLINGLKGSDSKYGGSEWLGYSGTDCSGFIEFSEETQLNTVSFRFFKGEGQWIYLPKAIEVSVSDDGIHYSSVVSTTEIHTDTKVANVSLPLKGIKGKYLKFEAKNFGTIPTGRQGAGYKSWLFIDEIVVD